ncbi:MAG: dTMP kinase [Pseudomonadales bacterium]
MISPGKFITVEGGEGVGKTTNIRFIQEFFEQRSIDLITTREPGGTPLAEAIRDILLAKSQESMHATTELLLVFAARAQHLAEVVKPALTAGKWVLCDRFTDATYAYQGGGRGLSTEHISLLENLVQQGLQPNLTVLLDIDPELGMQRARARAELDRFEIESSKFFESVRASYLNRAKQFPDRFTVIDAGSTLLDVQRDLANSLQRFLDHTDGV